MSKILGHSILTCPSCGAVNRCPSCSDWLCSICGADLWASLLEEPANSGQNLAEVDQSHPTPNPNC